MAAYTIDDPRDEGPLADLTSAGMWTAAGVIGASSFLQPLLLFTAMFVSYFFPALLAWPLMALFAFVYSTPLLYDDKAISENFPAHAASFAWAVAPADAATAAELLDCADQRLLYRKRLSKTSV
jgi:hypothetical protein